MKNCGYLNMRLLAALVVGMMLFASCAKDEEVAPCGSDSHDNGVAKGASLLPPPSPQDPSSDVGDEDDNGRGKTDPDPGTTISDDGDDLSDKERSNKKKAN